MTKALSLHVTGVVQGVGFRPFVYKLAADLGVSGWVRNASDGIYCVAEGDPEAVAAFARELRDSAPPMAVVESVTAEAVDPEGFEDFTIIASEAIEGAMTLVSPDIATCEACERELLDPADRRFRYPFINCTNCGPRFTIISDVPYDRPMTTMRDFPMCPECAAEYGDPADRRFHAQPDACFICGPRLYLNAADTPADWRWSPAREVTPRPHRERDMERTRSDALLASATQRVLGGDILAVKGLGGFQLACDATNETTVARLRERKHRWGKPLAVMVAGLDDVRSFCRVSNEEAALLSGPSRPIVLLRVREEADALAPSVAPGLAEVGVMLPYTPLHHLLLREIGRPLIMTSGNLAEEPIATGNAEALERLGEIADAFLMHDRDIYSRYDDSVTRVVRGTPELVRRARGFAPFPLRLPFESDIAILAAGPEQKNTFALVKGDYAFVSQHIGDMENAETLEHYERTLDLYQRLFCIQPELVAYDLHPEYLSTKFALGLDLPSVGVQHHHAHVVGVAAEHGISEPFVGVAFDGTGFGTDGHIWGGEILLARWDGFTRFAHLREMPLVGGASAIRRPARMAVAALHATGLLGHPGAEALRSRLAEGEERTLLTMIERNVNSLPTSSMGRLFDAVAALCGVRDDALYEGQAAIELEALADHSADGEYHFELVGGDPVVIDSAPVLEAVLADLAAGIPSRVISTRFHRAVVAAIVGACAKASSALGTATVTMAGGVFLNRLVLGGAMEQLTAAGMRPLTHLRLPVNDGGISYGQAVVAWARRHEV
ncbi:MAG: carbamoyltransferase HypF [Coriobacteriia bacterium]|nr:carbamoyltransferase HypF [Coriobacteriia bacterium]